MHEVRLHVGCGDHKVAAAVARALSLELAEGPEGTHAQARVRDATLEVDLHAGDLSSLRAAIQSTLRLAEAARQTAS